MSNNTNEYKLFHVVLVSFDEGKPRVLESFDVVALDEYDAVMEASFKVVDYKIAIKNIKIYISRIVDFNVI